VPADYDGYAKCLEAIPSPRLVYGGVADARLSPRLIKQVLDSFPDAQFVILGNVDDKAPEKLRTLLRTHERVHCLGRNPYGAYPYLYRSADVLLIAHRMIDFTRAMLPEKLNEYLASGKPIVSVPLPEVERIAQEAGNKNAIRIGRDAKSYVAAIASALTENDPDLIDARKRMAERRTWRRLGERADVLLRQVIQKKTAPAETGTVR